MGQDEASEIDRAISALQARTRRRILFDLYLHQPEWTVDNAAKAAGVHRTVAHAHLERLVALGYLAVGQRRGKSGKPANLYRLAGQQIDFSYPGRRFPPRPGFLAEGLQPRGQEVTRAAREAGRRYGAALVDKPAGSP